MRYVSIPNESYTRVYGTLLATVAWGKQFTERHGFFVRAAGAAAFATIAVYMAGGSIYLDAIRSAGASNAPSAAFSSETPVQGLTIANNGLAYIKGARVSSISDSRIVAISEWNGSTLRWTVRVGADTKIVLPNGEQGTLNDLDRGSYIAISGDLAGGSSNLAIEAQTVRLVSGDGGKNDASVRLEDLEG
jgi:hypothetical protein